MAALLVSLTLLASDPPFLVARESVDLVELNHYYDEHGRLVFDQVLFYDWWPSCGRYMLRGWRLVKSEGILPVRDGRGYRSTWFDGELLRDVAARQYRETWTQVDPELEERAFLDKDKRRELLKPPRVTLPCKMPELHK